MQTSTTLEPRIEVVAPDLGQETLAADDLPGVLDEVVEEPELAVGQARHALPDSRLPLGEVEHQDPAPDEVAVVASFPRRS